MPKIKFFPHCTEYPPQYWCYPPTVLMLSLCMYWCYPPNVLNVLHSTEAIPPLYWCYPLLYWTASTVLKVSPHGTEAIPHMYWRYTFTVLMLSPTVLMVSPRCTEQPPMYWTTSTVLNRRYMGWYRRPLKRDRLSFLCQGTQWSSTYRREISGTC